MQKLCIQYARHLLSGIMLILTSLFIVLVMLLRLRQICSHPALVQEEGTEVVLDVHADEDLTPELVKARRVLGSGFVAKMQHKMKTRALERIAAEKEVCFRPNRFYSFSRVRF
jgi:SNF2 family DNA or RNA helicase